MATVKQYVQAMRSAQRTVATKMGCDVAQAPKPDRVLNASLLAVVAVVVKTLTDKGVITDQELQAALNAAETDSYDDEGPVPL